MSDCMPNTIENGIWYFLPFAQYVQFLVSDNV